MTWLARRGVCIPPPTGLGGSAQGANLPPSTPKNVANPATSPTMDSADRLTSAKPPGISRGLRRPSAVRWNDLIVRPSNSGAAKIASTALS